MSFRKTDENGRVTSVHPQTNLESGIYKLKFETKKYFDELGGKTFYPYVEVRGITCYLKDVLLFRLFLKSMMLRSTTMYPSHSATTGTLPTKVNE